MTTLPAAASTMFPAQTPLPTGIEAEHGMLETPVSRWFGPAFEQLNPALQALHRHGGRLRGEVAIHTGSGLGRVIGRRLAQRLGIPLDRPRCGFSVEIRHDAEVLHWTRHFEGGGRMHSEFRPVGSWPDGYWIEQTGPLRLHLGVDIENGGWYWRLRSASWRGLPIPIALLPASRAYKRIVDGRYEFAVSFAMPVFGTVLAYSGLLEAESMFTPPEFAP